MSRTSATSSVDKGGSAPCPTGKVVFGGGFDIIGGAGETFIDDFIPTNASVLTFGMEHDDGSRRQRQGLVPAVLRHLRHRLRAR